MTRRLPVDSWPSALAVGFALLLCVAAGFRLLAPDGLAVAWLGLIIGMDSTTLIGTVVEVTLVAMFGGNR